MSPNEYKSLKIDLISLCSQTWAELSRDEKKLFERKFGDWTVRQRLFGLWLWNFKNLYFIHNFNEIFIFISVNPAPILNAFNNAVSPHSLRILSQESMIEIQSVDDGEWWADLKTLTIDLNKYLDTTREKRYRQHQQERQELLTKLYHL